VKGVTRYIFIGAGAIGSALAGLLARQDHEVLAVARGDHATAMVDKGLRLRCPDTDFTVPVATVTGPDSVKLTVDDLLVLTTKTQQAQAAIEQWADVPVHDHAGAVAGRAASLLPVFTALNGVASEEIALRAFDRVFAVSVWCPVVMIDPGEVIVRGEPPRGIFHVGRYGASSDPSGDAALLERVRGDWGDAGCRIVPTSDITGWKYRKLLTNLGNVLQALLGNTAGADGIARAADAEARETLAAASISYPDDEQAQAAWQDYVSKPVPGEPELLGGSSWQSLIRGTGSIETDYLNGEIALIARRIGRAAPVNAGLTALARKAAREGLRPGSISVAELRAQLGLL
jgi:2-dehydropantoate 2-reductase